MYIYIEIKQVRRNIWKEHKWLYDQPPAPTQNIIKHQIRIEPMTIVVFYSSYQNVIVHVVKLSNACLSALRWQNHPHIQDFPEWSVPTWPNVCFLLGVCWCILSLCRLDRFCWYQSLLLTAISWGILSTVYSQYKYINKRVTCQCLSLFVCHW